MSKNFIISFFIITNLITAAFCFGFHYRLVETRYELKSIRDELSAAKDQQREIREIIRGTDELLSESFDTINGIRSQIKIVRESYEKMENLLYSPRSNDTNYDGDTNNEKVKDERKPETKN